MELGGDARDDEGIDDFFRGRAVRVWHLIDFPWVLLQFSGANEKGETGA